MTTAAVGDRYRIVTVQDGTEHVSTVVIGADEVVGQLNAEADMHRMAGWEVDVLMLHGGVVVEVLATSPRDKSRRIFARSFTPHNDTPEGGDA